MTLFGTCREVMGRNGRTPSSCDSRCKSKVALMVSIMSWCNKSAEGVGGGDHDEDEDEYEDKEEDGDSGAVVGVTRGTGTGIIG